MSVEDEMSMDEIGQPEEAERTPEEVEAELSKKANALDLEAWIRGVTGIERAVTLYGNMAVTAEIDVAKTRLAELTKAQVASALDVVIDGVSAEALARRWKAVEDVKDAAGNKLSKETQLCRVIAQQIKEPAGFNAEILEVLNEKSPGQFGKILQAWKSVLEESNVQVAGITVPLSRGA